MPSPKELFDAGDLAGAIEAVTKEVKAKPTDPGPRTFLFELLLFSGDLDRSEKQMEVLGTQGTEAQLGVMVFRNCLKAERDREKLFTKALAPKFLTEPPHYVDAHVEAIKRTLEGNFAEARELLDKAEEARPSFPGTLNGVPFEDFRDYDDFLGPVFEVFVNDQYCWVSIEQVVKLKVQPPKKLRDLYWATASIESRDGSKGDVMLPCLYPRTATHADAEVRLGRMTAWHELAADVLQGRGSKTYLVGEAEHTLPELLDLTFGEPGT